jgi:hypothetical protein
LETKGWEIMFDSDGRLFRIANGNESLVLMLLRRHKVLLALLRILINKPQLVRFPVAI